MKKGVNTIKIGGDFLNFNNCYEVLINNKPIDLNVLKK